MTNHLGPDLNRRCCFWGIYAAMICQTPHFKHTHVELRTREDWAFYVPDNELSWENACLRFTRHFEISVSINQLENHAKSLVNRFKTGDSVSTSPDKPLNVGFTPRMNVFIICFLLEIDFYFLKDYMNFQIDNKEMMDILNRCKPFLDNPITLMEAEAWIQGSHNIIGL